MRTNIQSKRGITIKCARTFNPNVESPSNAHEHSIQTCNNHQTRTNIESKRGITIKRSRTLNPNVQQPSNGMNVHSVPRNKSLLGENTGVDTFNPQTHVDIETMTFSNDQASAEAGFVDPT